MDKPNTPPLQEKPLVKQPEVKDKDSTPSVPQTEESPNTKTPEKGTEETIGVP